MNAGIAADITVIIVQDQILAIDVLIAIQHIEKNMPVSKGKLNFWFEYLVW